MSSRTSTLKGRASIGGEAGRSSSPPPSRALEDLRRQLVKAKAELDSEKQKGRQLQRSHASALKDKKDELERKYKSSVETLLSRKEQEKLNELKLLEDKLNRQKDMEFRKQQREKNDELRELKLKLSKEHDLKLRTVLEAERQKLLEQYGGEDPSSAREAKLAREVFMRSEENEQLRDQMRLTREENRDLLDQIRRAAAKHEAELAQMLRQGKTEAAREVARLQLAERRLQEREQEVIDVEQRVGYAAMEKGSLVEEIERLKKAVEEQQHHHAQEMSASPSVHTHNQVLRRMGELESHNKKLEQQLGEHRQEIASLRKKNPLVSASAPSTSIAASSSPLKQPGVTSSMEDLSGVDRKVLERKLQDYRRRNKELLTLAKQLDVRQKALQIENNSLMESKSRDSTEAEKMLRKQFIKQQIKEREDHMKEMRTKERQITSLKKEIEKSSSLVAEASEVKSKSKEMSSVEANMKVVCRERLQLEMHLGKLLKREGGGNGSVLADLRSTDLLSSTQRAQELEEDNRRMKEELDRLRRELSQLRGADLELENSSLKTQLSSLKQQLEQQATDADNEIAVLSDQISSLRSDKATTRPEEQLASSLLGGGEGKAKVSQLHQRIQELEEDCREARQRAEREEAELTESRKEGSKLKKDLQKMPELQELLKTRDEEKQQLLGELDRSRHNEEERGREVVQLKASRKQELDSAREKHDKATKKLKEEAERLRSQLSSQKREADRLEERLREAGLQARNQAVLLEEKEKEAQRLQASLAAKKTPQPPSNRPVSTQCDLTAPKATSSPMASRVARPGPEAPASDPRTNPSAPPPPPVASTTARRNTVATMGEVTKETPETRQTRSMSIPGNPTTDRAAATPGGRRSIRGRPKSGSGRRSGGGLLRPGNRGAVPAYIAAAQGDSLQSELRDAGMEVEDVFDSEAVKITESEMDFDALGDDLLETTQSNISLDGFDSLPPIDKPLPSPVKSLSLEQQQQLTAGAVSEQGLRGGSSRPSTSESPETPGPGAGTGARRIIHQVRGSGDEDDDIIAVSNPSLPRVVEEGTSTPDDLTYDVSRPATSEEDPVSSSEASTSAFSPLVPPPGPVSLYRTLYDYHPLRDSPNPNPESELELIQGQPVVIYGTAREDGFFFGAIEDSKGLVPSNFVEKVKDLTDEEVREGSVSLGRSPVWGLQDIAEEEELLVPPPCDVKLERQFMDHSSPDTFKVVICWTPPTPAPANLSGYKVYVNNEHRVTVATETKVLLSDLPLNATCSVVVRTLSGDRESDPTSPPIVVGAKFPLAPTNLELGPAPGGQSLLLSWSDSSSSSPASVPATLYTVAIDNTQVTQAEPTNTGNTRLQCCLDRELFRAALAQPDRPHRLSVRAHHYKLESQDSLPLPLPLPLLRTLFHQHLEVESRQQEGGGLSDQSSSTAASGTGTAVVASVEVHHPPLATPTQPPRPSDHAPSDPEPNVVGNSPPPVVVDSSSNSASAVSVSSSLSKSGTFTKSVSPPTITTATATTTVTSTGSLENGSSSVSGDPSGGRHGNGNHDDDDDDDRRPRESVPHQHRFSILDVVGSEDSESASSEVESVVPPPPQPSIDSVVLRADHGVQLREKKMDRADRNRKAVATLLDLAADEEDEEEDSAQTLDDDDDNDEDVGGEVLEDDEEDDDEEDVPEMQEQVMFKEPRFYRAHTEYNPRYQSANVGMEDDELEFKAGDVIKVIGMENEDWLLGVLRGMEGVVPINLVSLVDDPRQVEEYTKEFDALLPPSREVWTNRNEPSDHTHNHAHPPQANGDVVKGLPSMKMIALFGYDPEKDSPNDPEDSKEELKFEQNDIIVVYGSVDSYGFHKGELSGKIGLVPSNYLKQYSEAPPPVAPPPIAPPTAMVIPSDEEESIASESVDSDIDFLPPAAAKVSLSGVPVANGR